MAASGRLQVTTGEVGDVRSPAPSHPRASMLTGSPKPFFNTLGRYRNRFQNPVTCVALSTSIRCG